MVFSSLSFLYVFLPVVLAGYYLIPDKFRLGWLLLSNLVFYAWGEPVYVILMLFSIFINFLSGLLIDRNLHSPRSCLGILIVTILIDIGLLGYFKYTAFFINTINSLFNSSFSWKETILPLGISFYTFQAMSYPIDVYRKHACVQKNIILFASYISLFPQLIAGPIVRYKDIEAQLHKRTYSIEQFQYGIQRFIIGLSKKVLIANNVGQIWDYYSAQLVSSGISVVGSWIGIIAFTLQIYFDFSGYSDMAIGLGKMLGFTFPENFNFPYMSSNITEFWRRWHMTLGTWFRDYVYIPLGGNRKGILRQIINILIVWAITGLWHGASWNFVLWGLYYAFLLIIEKLFLLKWQKRIPSPVNHIYTILAFTFGWVLFQMTSTSDLLTYIKSMFSNSVVINVNDYYMIRSYILVILCSVFFSTNWIYMISNHIPSKVKPVLKNCFLIMIFILSTAFLVNDTYNPFLYFRF